MAKASEKAGFDFVPLEYRPEDLAFTAVLDYQATKLAQCFALPPDALEAPANFGASPAWMVAYAAYQEKTANDLMGAVWAGVAASWDRRERICTMGHLHATHAGRVFCDLTGETRTRLAAKG